MGGGEITVQTLNTLSHLLPRTAAAKAELKGSDHSEKLGEDSEWFLPFCHSPWFLIPQPLIGHNSTYTQSQKAVGYCVRCPVYPVPTE